jgi:signal transduction histidine kinase
VTLEFVDTANASHEFSAYMDRNKIAQVVRNLLSNAIRFTPAEGQVKVEVCLEVKVSQRCAFTRTKHRLVVSIIDTGVGFTAVRHAYAFYFRSHQHVIIDSIFRTNWKN